MKKHRLSLLIAFFLFFIPFLWLPRGFVDVGGDSGRLYFIDPLASVLQKYVNQTSGGALVYAFFPYESFLYILKHVIWSPTYLIAFEHGLQLAVAFFSLYLIVRDLLVSSEHHKSNIAEWISIITGVVYVGFITKTGWVTSLETHNQVFLNPLIFFLLLRLLRTSQFMYAIGILVVTILYSGNFGFSAMPQLASFYPLAFLYLFLYVKLCIQRALPWKKIAFLGIFFFALHAFHIIPTIATVLDRESPTNAYIFSKAAQFSSGLSYFDFNRQTLGKLSVELFQPLRWNGLTMGIIVIPFFMVMGFLKKKSKELSLTSFFFALTFFLVSANITLTGVKIYRQLFYIPGFTMFRSFDEKWYYVFAFFYAQLAGLSLYALVQKSKRGAVFVFFIIGFSVLWRIWPFLQGAHYQETIYQSRNITKSFSMDPDLLDALSFVKKIPDYENFLTLPLTLPYFQVINGKEGGAYVGVSTVRYIGGKNDYAGFWYLEPFQREMFDAFKRNDTKEALQIFSLFNIRYIFRNTDQRVMDDFPKFPFYRYDITEDIPVINSQNSYDQFLKEFPITTVYEKGHFRISKFDDTVVRPAVYVPDILYASEAAALTGDSFRSAYVDEDVCAGNVICNADDNDVPRATYVYKSPGIYDVTFDIGNRTQPFVVSLAEYCHPSWTLEFLGENMPKPKHIRINGYANGWIIDPTKFQSGGTITGTMRLNFQRYFEWGRTVSVLSSIVLVVMGVYVYIKTYGFKK